MRLPAQFFMYVHPVNIKTYYIKKERTNIKMPKRLQYLLAPRGALLAPLL